MYGKILKTIRKNKGLTQQKIADILDVTRSNISKIEAGEHSLSETDRKKIEADLKINFDDYSMDEYNLKLKENAEKLKIAPKVLNEILSVAIKDPELLSYAVKAIKGDKEARERFIKLTE